MRLTSTQRKRVHQTEPPRKCKARSSRTGEPCAAWAVLGAVVCVAHGGRAPQVRAEADRRIALAEAMSRSERRSAVEILADTLHAADMLMRRAIAETAGTMTPEQLASVVEHLERAETFARSVLTLKLDDRRTAIAERQGAVMYGVFSRVLAGLGLSEEQQALVPGLLEREIRALTVPAIEGSAS